MVDLVHPSTAVVLSFIISVIIPLVSSLVSKVHWPSEVAGLITLFLAAVNGFFTEWATSSDVNHYDWKNAIMLAIGSFIIAILSRYGLWKDTETDAKLLRIGSHDVATRRHTRKAA